MPPPTASNEMVAGSGTGASSMSANAGPANNRTAPMAANINLMEGIIARAEARSGPAGYCFIGELLRSRCGNSRCERGLCSAFFEPIEQARGVVARKRLEPVRLPRLQGVACEGAQRF